MTFNPDIKKEVTEVYFSQRPEKSLSPPIISITIMYWLLPARKIWVLSLDSKLIFNEHVNQKINKCNRIIGLIKRLSLMLSRNQLLTIYKTFITSHLDYADIIYDKPFNDSFKEQLEKVQCSAALIITGAIKDTSRERLYQELGLESLCGRTWNRKLAFFYKTVKGLAPSYLQSYLLPDNERTYSSTSRNTIKTFATQTSTFSATFFPYGIKEWN